MIEPYFSFTLEDYWFDGGDSYLLMNGYKLNDWNTKKLNLYLKLKRGAVSLEDERVCEMFRKGVFYRDNKVVKKNERRIMEYKKAFFYERWSLLDKEEE